MFKFELIGKIKDIEKTLDNVSVREWEGKQFKSSSLKVECETNAKQHWTTTRFININGTHLDFLEDEFLDNDDIVAIQGDIKPSKDKNGNYRDYFNAVNIELVYKAKNGENSTPNNNLTTHPNLNNVDDIDWGE